MEEKLFKLVSSNSGRLIEEVWWISNNNNDSSYSPGYVVIETFPTLSGQ